MIQSGLWGKLVRHSIGYRITCLVMPSSRLTLCFDTAQTLVRYCSIVGHILQHLALQSLHTVGRPVMLRALARRILLHLNKLTLIAYSRVT
jgi:hypothetical protein